MGKRAPGLATGAEDETDLGAVRFATTRSAKNFRRPIKLSKKPGLAIGCVRAC